MRAYCARAPRCAGGNRSMHNGRAMHEQKATLLRGKAVLPLASPGPGFVGWLARVAHLRATALALPGD